MSRQGQGYTIAAQDPNAYLRIEGDMATRFGCQQGNVGHRPALWCPVDDMTWVKDGGPIVSVRNHVHTNRPCTLAMMPPYYYGDDKEPLLNPVTLAYNVHALKHDVMRQQVIPFQLLQRSHAHPSKDRDSSEETFCFAPHEVDGDNTLQYGLSYYWKTTEYFLPAPHCFLRHTRIRTDLDGSHSETQHQVLLPGQAEGSYFILLPASFCIEHQDLSAYDLVRLYRTHQTDDDRSVTYYDPFFIFHLSPEDAESIDVIGWEDDTSCLHVFPGTEMENAMLFRILPSSSQSQLNSRHQDGSCLLSHPKYLIYQGNMLNDQEQQRPVDNRTNDQSILLSSNNSINSSSSSSDMKSTTAWLGIMAMVLVGVVLFLLLLRPKWPRECSRQRPSSLSLGEEATYRYSPRPSVSRRIPSVIADIPLLV
jgi:hypothetical protein